MSRLSWWSKSVNRDHFLPIDRLGFMGFSFYPSFPKSVWLFEKKNEKSLSFLKKALDINTGKLVYYYVMRIDNLTNLIN